MFTLCNDFVYHVIRRPGEILHRIDGGRGLIEPVRRFQTTLRNNDHRFPVHRCTRERMKLRGNTRFRVPAHLSQANWDDSRVPVTLCHVCFHCSSDAIDSFLSFFILSLSTVSFLPFYSNGLCLFIKQEKNKKNKICGNLLIEPLRSHADRLCFLLIHWLCYVSLMFDFRKQIFP